MKMMDIVKIILIFSAAYALKTTAFAADQVVDVPEEELAKESVLPPFDDPTSVRKRNVVTAGRFELGFMNGMALTEAISNVSKLGVNFYYNFNEDHALGIFFSTHQTGFTNYANQLSASYSFDFTRVPSPQTSMYLDYNTNAYYGKMSITDQMVFNMKLYFSFTLGQVTYALDGVSKGYPLFALGLGQKFYFTKSFALRFDLRIQGNNGPIPFLKGQLTNASSRPLFDDFNERLHVSNLLDTGLTYLF